MSACSQNYFMTMARVKFVLKYDFVPISSTNLKFLIKLEVGCNYGRVSGPTLVVYFITISISNFFFYHFLNFFIQSGLTNKIIALF